MAHSGERVRFVAFLGRRGRRSSLELQKTFARICHGAGTLPGLRERIIEPRAAVCRGLATLKTHVSNGRLARWHAFWRTDPQNARELSDRVALTCVLLIRGRQFPPESPPRRQRQRDYRFCWLRDSVLALEALTAVGKVDEHLWPRWKKNVEHIETIWREPDDGIWETRGPRRHFTYSKVMAWVVFDRALRIAEQFELDAPVARWRRIRPRG